MVKINFHEEWANGDLKLVLYTKVKEEEGVEDSDAECEDKDTSIEQQASASATGTEQDSGEPSRGKKRKLEDDEQQEPATLQEEENEEKHEEHILYASSVIMTIWSPVFAAMLSDGSFKEGTSKEVKLPGKEMEDVLELLEVVHPTRKAVTIENAYRLLPLAHEYQIPDIVDQCELCIMSNDLTIPNIQLADDYGLAKLRAACIHHVGKFYPRMEIIYNKHFQGLSEKSRFALLSNKIALLEFKFNDHSKFQNAGENSRGCKRNDKPLCSECARLPVPAMRPSKSCTKKIRAFYKKLFE